MGLHISDDVHFHGHRFLSDGGNRYWHGIAFCSLSRAATCAVATTGWKEGQGGENPTQAWDGNKFES